VNDLRHGAEQRPDLLKKYIEIEKKIGHTMFMKNKQPIPLDEYLGIKAQEEPMQLSLF
jgi:hypothetical protein